MARPLGVTILGFLQVAGGVSTTFVGIAALRNPNVVANLGLPPDFASFGRALGPIMIAAGILNLASGWGLLKLRNWARVLVLAITALSLAGAALGILFSGVAHEPLANDVLRLFVFALDGLIIWYLLRPESRRVFTPTPPGGRPPAAPPGSPAP